MAKQRVIPDTLRVQLVQGNRARFHLKPYAGPVQAVSQIQALQSPAMKALVETTCPYHSLACDRRVRGTE